MNLEENINTLKNGGVILYPTDTIWGIGCDATNDQACQKIMEIKGRSSEKSFIVLVDSVQMLEKYVPDFHSICYDLIDTTVRPLTIIYPSAKLLAPSVLAADGSVGIRVTTDPICKQLIRGLKKPIISTSANISGEKSPTQFNTISEHIKSAVDSIVMERLSESMEQPSQIIQIGLDGSVKIIRK